MRTLTDRGWVAPVDGGSRLRLGLRALQVGSRFVDEDEVVAHVGPSLDRLAAVTGETVQQARLDGDQVVYLAKRDTSHPVRIISSIGTRLPAHATALGKALLAADPGAGARLAGPLVALTPHTLRRACRGRGGPGADPTRGYAVDDGEAAEGLRCFAVVVPAGRGVGAPTDAISVSVPILPARRRARVPAGRGAARRAAAARRPSTLYSSAGSHAGRARSGGRGPCPG